MDDFKNYTNAIGFDYDSQDVTFTGHVYKLISPHFNNVKQSVYGRSKNYMKEIVENHQQNCYVPTSSMCFLKPPNHFTDTNYTEEFQDFIRKENYRSGVIKSVRIQLFCIRNDFNIGLF